ncbi:MAG: SWIM zinc finger family protein [Bacilli bacterium]|nr:SWIM zinc finger family protein [Bacilli bacterium]
MASNEYDVKLKKIKNYFKKEKLFFDMYLENYEGYYIYIRLDYYKKFKGYKLSWFDLDIVDIDNMDKSLSSEWIFDDTINSFNEIINKLDTSKEYKYDNSKGRVTINIDAIKRYSVSFYKFIPSGLADISNLIFTIFNSLPRRLETFLFELHAELFGTIGKYEYKEEFKFDLFNDDLTNIFEDKIIARGKKYREEGKVSFLEKIGDRYYAIVDGNQTYVVVISYNEKEKITQVYCSCPCEFYCKHIYAVIEAIRNKEFKAFYKISYVRSKDDLFERMMNFGFILCLSIVGDYFLVINRDNELELVSILEEDGSCNWKVFDEDENETLSKKIEELLKNK